jgi:hypothetical protein
MTKRRNIDYVVSAGWRFVILGMICFTGFAALFLGFQAMHALLGAQWHAAVLPLLLGGLLAAAAYLLCRNRNDLLWV